MTATYLHKGQGKSDNAYYAERCGKYPLTTAVKVISRALKPYYKITQKTIREWLEKTGSDEYHHVGKYATICYYYDTSVIIESLLDGDYENGFLDFICIGQ